MFKHSSVCGLLRYLCSVFEWLLNSWTVSAPYNSLVLLETCVGSCSRDSKQTCMQKLPLLRYESFISMIKRPFINICITPHSIFFPCTSFIYNTTVKKSSWFLTWCVCSLRTFCKASWKHQHRRDYYDEFRWVLFLTSMFALKVPVLCSSLTLTSPSLCTFSCAFLFRRECINLHLKKSSLYFLWFSAIFLQIQTSKLYREIWCHIHMQTIFREHE